MKCGIVALALICIGAISSTAGLASGQTRSEPLDKASRHVRQDVKRQQIDMSQSMRRTRAEMDRVRRDMDNQMRAFRVSVSTLKQSDLLHAGAGLMRGVVLTQPTLPNASPDVRLSVTTDSVRAAPPTQVGGLTVGTLADSVLPGAGTAFQTARAVSALRSAYLVGTGIRLVLDGPASRFPGLARSRHRRSVPNLEDDPPLQIRAGMAAIAKEACNGATIGTRCGF